jgi:hypothetical protein
MKVKNLQRHCLCANSDDLCSLPRRECTYSPIILQKSSRCAYAPHCHLQPPRLFSNSTTYLSREPLRGARALPHGTLGPPGAGRSRGRGEFGARASKSSTVDRVVLDMISELPIPCNCVALQSRGTCLFRKLLRALRTLRHWGWPFGDRPVGRNGTHFRASRDWWKRERSSSNNFVAPPKGDRWPVS